MLWQLMKDLSHWHRLKCFCGLAMGRSQGDKGKLIQEFTVYRTITLLGMKIQLTNMMYKIQKVVLIQ